MHPEGPQPRNNQNTIKIKKKMGHLQLQKSFSPLTCVEDEAATEQMHFNPFKTIEKSTYWKRGWNESFPTFKNMSMFPSSNHHLRFIEKHKHYYAERAYHPSGEYGACTG
jgi:hypothetical protein